MLQRTLTQVLKNTRHAFRMVIYSIKYTFSLFTLTRFRLEIARTLLVRFSFKTSGKAVNSVKNRSKKLHQMQMPHGSDIFHPLGSVWTFFWELFVVQDHPRTRQELSQNRCKQTCKNDAKKNEAKSGQDRKLDSMTPVYRSHLGRRGRVGRG